LGNDDGLDVLQVDGDDSLTVEKDGRGGEEFVEVIGGEANAPIDGVLPGLYHLFFPCPVEEETFSSI